MPAETLISYAQNGEDVVLWRALGHVTDGVYVDVGGWDPDVDSVTRLFYERGWRGIDVEPVPDFARKFAQRRPGNEIVQAVVTDQDIDHLVLHRFGGSGLSTIDEAIASQHADSGLPGEDIEVPARRLDDVLASSKLVGDVIHFLKVDVEGAEDQVLRSVDLARWRPWVLVVEATEPNSTAQTHHAWEPIVLEAGYTFTLFDGLSRFYVSPDHPELVDALSYPACALDSFEPVTIAELRASLDEKSRALEDARRQAMTWRHDSVSYWTTAVARVQKSDGVAKKAATEAARLRSEAGRLRKQLQETREDRKRLRAEVRRLRSEVEALQRRLASRPTARLRAAVKKATRA